MLAARSLADTLRLQETRLILLLTNVKRYNTLYSRLLRDVPEATIQKDPFRVLSHLPLMDKALMMQNMDDLYCPVPGRHPIPKQTGGSTGTPFRYSVDREYVSHLWGFVYSVWHRYAGYEPGMPYLTIGGSSLRSSSIASGLMQRVYHALQNCTFVRGDVIRDHIHLNQARLAHVRLLYGYPSSIAALTNANPTLPQSMNNIRAIFTTSEQLTQHTRHVLEQAYSVPVFDMYGANDGGILSGECSEHNGYHHNMTHCYVETHPHECGENEIVLTNLASYSLPFIRYRVGDLGRICQEPCPCGVPSYRITCLAGRTRDLLRLPDGTSIHGSFVNKVMLAIPSVLSYRIVQQPDRTVILFLSVAKENTFEHVASAVRSAFGKILTGVTLDLREGDSDNIADSKRRVIESNAV